MNDEVDDLFFRAREMLDPDQRAAFLESSCKHSPKLRVQIERMLAIECGAESFFTEALSEHKEGDSTRPISLASEERVAGWEGQMIGRYKLLQRIGEGGFGSVWMAEQTEPVTRRVALKVIKLGMDTKQVVARFEAERQALAMMDHPNIARVFDAGATDTGRPFFVMELVQGVKITDYCDQNNLSTKERLGLCVQICHAIQHAHQKGIIHRDIKPSNILVSVQDGKPVPKVIDFGIAKATEGRLTDATAHTQLHQFIGTPAYMSPEQAVMSGLDIDTRSDIYSLGVLLYELLTGKTPFDAQELMSQGIDAMRRAIREKEPVRPSSKLTTLKREELATTAKLRSADTAKLLHQLEGDLDWIVMKCLEKDRTRRYETANDVALDIQRHLSCEPVLARPPSKLYEFQKTVRRHKFGFAATAAIILLLVSGVLISTWQAKLAREATAVAIEAKGEASARAEAEREARNEAEAVTRFLMEVFQSPSPGRDGRTITVAETLDRASETLDHDFSSQPALRARLQASLGATYQALDLYREAIPLQEKALAYFESVAGIENVSTYEISLSLTLSYLNAGRAEDTLGLCEKLLPFLRDSLGTENPQTARAMRNLAGAYRAAGRAQDALKLFQEARDVFAKVSGPAHSSTLESSIALAACYEDLGQWDEAQKLRESVLVLSRNPPAPKRQTQAGIPIASTSNSNYTSRARTITLKEWNELNGKLVVVSAIPIIPTDTGIILESGDEYLVYPCPSDTWNTAPKRWKDVDFRGHTQQLERTVAGKPYMQLCYRIGKSRVKAVEIGEIVSGTGPLYLMPSDAEGGGIINNNTGSIRVKIVKVD